LISKEYGWTDEVILKLPYYRFCQILETIDRRLLKEWKMKLEIKEVITRFETSIFALGAFLTKKGKNELLSIIDDFNIFKKDKTEKKEDKKLPKVGSYERLMNIFSGGHK